MFTFWFIPYGILIATIVVVLWLIFAYYYKSSVSRLSKLAAKKYIPTVPADIQSSYVIQCNPTLSSYDSSTGKFTAVITFKPDLNHPDAPPRNNVTKIYDIISDPNPCENNVVACAEVNQDKCLSADAKTIVVKSANCINIS